MKRVAVAIRLERDHPIVGAPRGAHVDGFAIRQLRDGRIGRRCLSGWRRQEPQPNHNNGASADENDSTAIHANRFWVQSSEAS